MKLFKQGEFMDTKLYLTVDDGPNLYTYPIACILAEKKIKATFFLTGTAIEKNVANMCATKNVFDLGHEIGNHGYVHNNLKHETPEAVERDILATQRIILSVTGQLPTKFRPPYMQWNQDYNFILIKLNLKLNMNFIAIKDATKKFIIDYGYATKMLIKHRIKKRELILLIHSRKHTLEGLHKLINWYEAKGCTFVDDEKIY